MNKFSAAESKDVVEIPEKLPCGYEDQSPLAVDIFQPKRQRDVACMDIIMKEAQSEEMSSKEKKRKKGSKADLVALKFSSMSLQSKRLDPKSPRNKTRQRMSRRNGTNNSTNKKSDNTNNTAGKGKTDLHQKRRISTSHRNRTDERSDVSDRRQKSRDELRHKLEQNRKQQLSLRRKAAVPEDSKEALVRKFYIDHFEGPCLEDTVIKIYRRCVDRKERRCWLKQYPWIRESLIESGIFRSEDEGCSESEREEEDDEFVNECSYYIEGQHGLDEEADDWRYFDGDDEYEADSNSETHPANEYPDEGTDSAKDYFTSDESDEADDDIRLC